MGIDEINIEIIAKILLLLKQHNKSVQQHNMNHEEFA